MDKLFSGRLFLLVGLLALAPVLSGCGARADDQQELTVFAASSLTEVFEDLGDEFSRQNPGVNVRFNFAGSPTLLAQLRQGSPADVFAPADKAKTDAAENAGIISTARVFAGNELVILVPTDNPAEVGKVRDLAEPNLDLVLAQKGVPVSGYTDEILSKSGVRYGPGFEGRILNNVVSREANVRAAVNRVVIGEADATFAYASDVTPEVREEIGVVEIPAELNVDATYPVAAVKDSAHPGLARKWVDLATSEKGQQIVEKWGFERVE